MSAESEWSEFAGYTEWPGSEPSTDEVEYPKPIPIAGRVVQCPAEECSWVGVSTGWPSHHRLTHVDR